MNCVECGGKTCVRDSRNRREFTERRRECTRCKHKFSTHEKLIQTTLGRPVLNDYKTLVRSIDTWQGPTLWIPATLYYELDNKEKLQWNKHPTHPVYLADDGAEYLVMIGNACENTTRLWPCK